MAEIHEGGCLCGAVRYQVTDEPYLAAVCHCTGCQKISGSTLRVAAYFDESAVHIKSGALKTYEFRSEESDTIRLPANDHLQRKIAESLTRPVGRPSNKPVFRFKSFLYQAASWKIARRWWWRKSNSIAGNCSPVLGSS